MVKSKSKNKNKNKNLDIYVKLDETIDDTDIHDFKLLSRKVLNIQNNNLEETIKSFLLNNGYVSLSIY